MTRIEAATVAVIIGALFALALFAERPAWTRRGRHHVHAMLLARPFERERPTVEAIATRIRREAESRAQLGQLWLSIEPSVHGFQAAIREQLEAIA